MLATAISTKFATPPQREGGVSMHLRLGDDPQLILDTFSTRHRRRLTPGDDLHRSACH
jgi:hypothetical protein